VTTQTAGRESTRLSRALERATSAVRFARDPLFWREVAPVGLAVALLPWLYICLHNYAHGTVWRDTTMYTYPAWCVLHGERLYDTVAVPDGPLAIIIHIFMVLVGDTKEELWRQFDLAFHIGVGAALGALVARPARRFAVVRRVSWAIVGVAMWLTQLMAFDFPASTQREAYYCGMGMLGVVLVYASSDRSKRVAQWMLFGGALLAGWTFWGKQTAGIYLALAALTTLVLPSTPGQPLKWRLRWVAIGAGASVVSILAFVVLVGSVRGMMLWYFRYNLEYYRYHDIAKMTDVLGFGWGRDGYNNAGIVLVVGLTAIAARVLPLSTAAFAIGPALEAASAVAQMRGWRYHYIPADFCAGVFFLVALARAWGGEEQDDRRVGAAMPAALGGFLFVAWWTLGSVTGSPWLHESESHTNDPAGLDPMAAGRVLAAHTHSDDRVFHFGDDPGVTFFAKRRPATPYTVAWMRDLVRHVPLGGELRLTAKQEARVRDLQRQLQEDDCNRVVSDPPPALVFHDGSVGYSGSIIEVVYGYCPALKPIVEKRYHQIAQGPYHIYLREDRP
jgi:hypothetical protein